MVSRLPVKVKACVHVEVAVEEYIGVSKLGRHKQLRYPDGIIGILKEDCVNSIVAEGQMSEKCDREVDLRLCQDLVARRSHWQHLLSGIRGRHLVEEDIVPQTREGEAG